MVDIQQIFVEWDVSAAGVPAAALEAAALPDDLVELIDEEGLAPAIDVDVTPI